MNTVLIVLLFSAICVCAVTCANVVQGNKRCTDNTRSCSDRSECCSGCCYLGSCDSPDRCSAMSQGACAVHYCPADKECYLEKVQCVTAPCPPIPACRPKNSEDYNNYD